MTDAMNEFAPGNGIEMKISDDGSGRGAAMVAAVAVRLASAGGCKWEMCPNHFSWHQLLSLFLGIDKLFLGSHCKDSLVDLPAIDFIPHLLLWSLIVIMLTTNKENEVY